MQANMRADETAVPKVEIEMKQSLVNYHFNKLGWHLLPLLSPFCSTSFLFRSLTISVLLALSVSLAFSVFLASLSCSHLLQLITFGPVSVCVACPFTLPFYSSGGGE